MHFILKSNIIEKFGVKIEGKSQRLTPRILPKNKKSILVWQRF